jgi:membrane-associated phospholipid phosphatase
LTAAPHTTDAGASVAIPPTAPAAPNEDAHGPPLAAPVTGLRWWREVLLIACFYAAYTVIRDLRGTRPVSAAVAFANARHVIAIERALGVFHESEIQHWFLPHRAIVEILDVWYGSAHFIVTGAVILILFFAQPSRYRRWRNTLGGVTLLALIGFAWFPLMPPRLLPAHYGFTDTLQTIGGLWSFNSGPMPHLTDQFAAMPSLHFAWALWSGLAIAGGVKRPWVKALALLYPTVTLVCVIVTANHFFVDTAAGAAIVVVAYGLARTTERAAPKLRACRRAADVGVPTGPGR